MDHNGCTDRMQLVVAAMTKDYEKARDLANAILKIHPDDQTVQKYSSTLEKEINKRKKMQEDDSEDDSTETDDDNDDNSESSMNESDTDCSTESNSDTEETIIISSNNVKAGDCENNSMINHRVPDGETFRQNRDTKNSQFQFILSGDSVSCKLKSFHSHNFPNQNTKHVNMENKHPGAKSKRSDKNSELEGKIIRVLPVKLSPVVRYYGATQRRASIKNIR